MKNSNENEKEQCTTGYSVLIDSHLHERINKHLKLLKLDEKQKLSKQQWILKALKDKLVKENNPTIPKRKHLQFKMDSQTQKEIDSLVNLIKRCQRNYSKKQLILEAIQEQLENEENMAKGLLEKIKNST